MNATVRRQTASEKLIATFACDRLHVFVIPDLTSEQALDEAIRGCKYVVHVASTVPSKEQASGIDIDSAISSIESVMNSAVAHASEKVVLTSSMSTHLDVKAPIQNESTWYTPDRSSTKLMVQYMSSKTLVERRAWELSSTLKLPLTTVAPVYIGGPTIIHEQDPKSSVSNQDLLRCIEDESRSRIPGWIDVRTVAHLHLHAIEDHSLNGRRILACTHNRGVVPMDCSLMNSLLAKDSAALIDFDRTKRDLLEQIDAFDSGQTRRVIAQSYSNG